MAQQVMGLPHNLALSPAAMEKLGTVASAYSAALEKWSQEPASPAESMDFWLRERLSQKLMQKSYRERHHMWTFGLHTSIYTHVYGGVGGVLRIGSLWYQSKRLWREDTESTSARWDSSPQGQIPLCSSERHSKTTTKRVWTWCRDSG